MTTSSPICHMLLSSFMRHVLPSMRRLPPKDTRDGFKRLRPVQRQARGQIRNWTCDQRVRLEPPAPAIGVPSTRSVASDTISLTNEVPWGFRILENGDTYVPDEVWLSSESSGPSGQDAVYLFPCCLNPKNGAVSRNVERSLVVLKQHQEEK